MRDKIEAALNILDGLADVWGDEARFRRARDMLREALQSTADDDEPITAEWCLANGAKKDKWCGDDVYRWEFQELLVEWDASCGLAIDVRNTDTYWVTLTEITTRGRLRHLLSALRENET